MSEPIIQVKNLKTHFYTSEGIVPAVDGVDITIHPGETVALVGESGSGKSVTSISIMRLVPQPPGKIVEGEILFHGENLLNKTEGEMRKIRGNRISMIFQEPMTSLNPAYRVGEQIMEALSLHLGLNKDKALAKAIEMLTLVGIPSPEKRVYDYPHQLSGGMRQRVMIAMALACHPEVLIADEPTTALDVTIQAQILDLLRKLRKEMGTSILLITHDLGVVAEMADRVAVMYGGKIVEKSGVNHLFANPLHPYTQGLLKSIPTMEGKKEKLYAIEGVVPNPLHLPPGCRFAPRCPYAQDICREKEPELKQVADKRWVSCWLKGEGQ